MAITLAWSAYVRHNSPAPTGAQQQLSDEVREYLEAHLTGLREKANGGSAPPATFGSSAGSNAFDFLKSGTNQQFDSAAEQLARSLHTAMDARTKHGLFVALRLNDGAAVLKLDVVSQHAGFLDDQQHINVVDNLLDIPGELQKGALIPDVRPTSTVIVGDKLGDTSQYFLTALDISQLQKPRNAVADVARVVYRDLPEEKAEAVIAKLPESEAVTVDDFLDSVSDVVPTETREAVLETLRSQPRPARYLDPKGATVKKTIKGAGITISGSIGDMANVRLEPVEGTDKWRLEVIFPTKPVIHF